MNVDHILQTMNNHGVDCLLIGGMNFLLRHEPVVTYDIDLWIEDIAANRRRCEAALAALDAQWGESDEDWAAVAAKPTGWLDRQEVFCVTSPHGAIDIFRSVRGLSDWRSCAARAAAEATSSGTSFRGLSDADMLKCQLALDEPFRKQSRVATLRRALEGDTDANE